MTLVHSYYEICGGSSSCWVSSLSFACLIDESEACDDTSAEAILILFMVPSDIVLL